jgi:uncharacterized protein YndB with AHSA1/START domain
MSDTMTLDAYGTLIEPATLKIQRLLPGPIDRVWAYLMESDLRRQWLASGVMGSKPGTSFEFVWRNDELTDPPGQRPEGMSEEHRMTCTIIECAAPHRLVISWGEKQTGEVAFTLEKMGDKVMLTIIHRRLPEGNMLLCVAAGWHAHLDVLAARLTGTTPAPHWDHWNRLHAEYTQRLPA